MALPQELNTGILIFDGYRYPLNQALGNQIALFGAARGTALKLQSPTTPDGGKVQPPIPVVGWLFPRNRT